MIKEAICSKEVCLLIEQNLGGTPLENVGYYDQEGNIHKWNEIDFSGECQAFSQSVATAWLRQMYSINLYAEEKVFCETSYDGMRVKKLYYQWCPKVQLLHDNKTKTDIGFIPINSRMVINADSYELAIDEGIKWLLENLIYE